MYRCGPKWLNGDSSSCACLTHLCAVFQITNKVCSMINPRTSQLLNSGKETCGVISPVFAKEDWRLTDGEGLASFLETVMPLERH
jgi:hypothetical protein